MQKNNFQLDLTASCNISWGLFDHFQKMFSQYISDMFRVSLMNTHVRLCLSSVVFNANVAV